MSLAWKIFGRFLAAAALVAVALAVLGYLPTRRLAGEEAIPAMFVGLAIAALASLLGVIPVFRGRDLPHIEAWSVAMAAMGVRLAIAVVLGAAVALAGVVPSKPLLAWVLIGHAAFMVPDTLLSIKILARQALAEER